MELSKGDFWRLGLCFAVAWGASNVIESHLDHRTAYPDGMVCATTLKPGESPGSLADDSLFKASENAVIRRSQFLNPQAVLNHADNDNSHYFIGSAFNVMPKESIKPKHEAELVVESDFRKSDCTIALGARKEFVSKFPTLEAASRILKSTVAVIEKDPRKDNVKFRRCGAIAVGGSKLLLPTPDYAWDEHECLELKSAEDSTEPLKVVSEKTTDGWRFLNVDKTGMYYVDTADNYRPKYGDTLVYSGYSRGGSRQYFRVRVDGMKDDELLLRAGLDQIVPDTEYGYAEMRNGGGGIFTLDGRLVAMTEGAAKFKEHEFLASDAYSQYLREYNQSLRELTEDFKYMNSYDTSDRDNEQLVFARRIYADDIDYTLPPTTS